MTTPGGAFRNPLVVLGAGILLVTGATGLVVDISLETYVAQSSVPVLVGGCLLAYGWYIREEMMQGFRRTILVWVGYGLASFFVVGFWFGFLSRRFDTSFLLAVVASLSIGAAFGALVGLYAARLQRTSEELAAEKDRLEQFAGIVSHDLRNPLSVAQGRVELLRKESNSEQLAAIARSLDRMDALINDVLTLVRQDTEITERSAVDIGVLGNQCWQTVETADATLETEITKEVRGDPSQLQQLMENLIRNAIEHGGESVTLTVGELEEGSGFYIADDGPGIPEADRRRVFEEGYSTAGDGTGLGLTIVKQVVEAHGWEISVTDGADGGARFEITGVEFATGRTNPRT